MFRKLTERLRRRRDSQRTLIELERLSDRELEDIGLTRWRIRDVALNSGDHANP